METENRQEVWVDPTGSDSNCKRYEVKDFLSIQEM